MCAGVTTLRCMVTSFQRDISDARFSGCSLRLTTQSSAPPAPSRLWTRNRGQAQFLRTLLESPCSVVESFCLGRARCLCPRLLPITPDYSPTRCGQRRKRAEEDAVHRFAAIANEPAAAAQQGCGAKVSAAIEIIEHRATRHRLDHAVRRKPSSSPRCGDRPRTEFASRREAFASGIGEREPPAMVREELAHRDFIGRLHDGLEERVGEHDLGGQLAGRAAPLATRIALNRMAAGDIAHRPHKPLESENCASFHLLQP